jgi:N-acetylmuramoyl-L-alanine amidase
MFKHENGEIAYEGDFNRKLAYILGQILTGLGYDVVFTVDPHDATDLSLKKRVSKTNEYVKQANKSIFVSIHADACKSHKARGWSIFTTKKQNISDILAEYIANSVEPYMREVSKVRFDTYSDGDKDKEANHYVTKGANCSSVLIENGFFDNWEDWKQMRGSEHRTKLATYIVDGIDNFFNRKNNDLPK